MVMVIMDCIEEKDNHNLTAACVQVRYEDDLEIDLTLTLPTASLSVGISIMNGRPFRRILPNK